MNPFTRFLSQWSRNRSLDEFIEQWDALESIVVRVYRQKITPEAARPQFEHVWPWLRQHYGQWEAALRPFWQATKAAGARTQTDPFRLLMNIQNPEEIPGDWRAMQHLPAAREALNRYILSQSDEK